MSASSTSAIELAQHLAQQFAARADEADRLSKLPNEDVQALKDSGYLGLSVPQEYGGQGLSLKECVAAHLELAQGSGSTAMVAGMQLHLFITETANEVTDKALRIAGGLSLTKSLPLERYFRDVRAGLMQPPSGDTALEIIGQNAIELHKR